MRHWHSIFLNIIRSSPPWVIQRLQEWILSHCGIPKNDFIDAAAKRSRERAHGHQVDIPYTRFDSARLTFRLAKGVQAFLQAHSFYHHHFLHNFDSYITFKPPSGLAHSTFTALHRLRGNAACTQSYLHLSCFPPPLYDLQRFRRR